MDYIPEKYKIICAKTDPQKSGFWLPFWMHAIDTADVMEYLCTFWLSPAAKKNIGLTEDILIQTSVFLGMVHDIGKATENFQWKITMSLPFIRDYYNREEVILSDSKAERLKIPHALAGEMILSELLPDNQRVHNSLSLIVGAHHGKPTNNVDKEKYSFNMHAIPSKSYWHDFWSFWVDYSLTYANFTKTEELPQLNFRAQMLMSGLLIMADWIASNTEWFPLVDLDDVNRIEDIYPERTIIGIERLRLPEMLDTDNIVTEMFDFSRRFGFSENLLQKALIDIVSSCHRPGIVVIEDQMGSGKTEAALAAAEIISHEEGCRGLFFGLPTQATANGIFPRLLKWGESQSERMIRSIRLAHGGAEYSKDYQAIRENSVILSDEDNEGGLIVHEWFSGRKKALLADFVIGTVDQLLMADLRQKHVMLRHLGLAGKVVIVDECHAYDAFMNVYLQGILEWLGAYGIPTILLSATLPADTRMGLLRAYMGKNIPDEPQKDNADYPRLTWSDGDEINHISLPIDPSNGKIIKTYPCRDEELPQKIQNLISDGGCAAVIVNTVKRSQEFYHILTEQCPDMTILLCHSHYTVDDRIRREKKLLEKVGKMSTGRQRDKVVVVGTQVLEQSLDYDVDVMFSDLCPIDLLLQRMGRLHRHKGRNRPKSCMEPKFYILKADEEKLEPGADAIYGAFILERSKICLNEEIRLPEDIGRLVQKVYAVGTDLGIKDEDSLREQYLEHIRKKKQKASVFKMKRPDRKPIYRSLYTLQGLISGDIPDNENRAKAAVRDGEDAIEVIVLRKDKEGSVCFLPWVYDGEYVYTEGLPSEEEARCILQQKMRLPAVFSTNYMIDKTLKELEQVFEDNFCEWKPSVWLGREMILLLDDHCEAKLNGYKVSYKENLGFEYFRE